MLKNRDAEYKDITLDDILEGRRNCNRGFEFFYDRIIQGVTGKKAWKKYQWKEALKPMGDMDISVTDEAFALWVLVNNFEKWEEQVIQNTETIKSGGKFIIMERKGNVTGDGWTKEGWEAFNSLCNKVMHDRLENAALEQQVLTRKQDGRQESNKRKKRQKREEPEEEAFPVFNELMFPPTLDWESQYQVNRCDDENSK